MDFQNNITLVVAIERKLPFRMHEAPCQDCISADRANFQNWGGRWERRNKFMRYMKTVLEELDIGYCMPLQPISFHPTLSLNLLQGAASGASSGLSSLGPLMSALPPISVQFGQS